MSFPEVVQRSSWIDFPSRLVNPTLKLLDMLDEFEATATFFCLGCIARKHGRLIREIARRGHEVACHSYWHRPIHELSPSEFHLDCSQSKHVIEQEAGVAINGFRAPIFSITKRTLWAFDILAETGFTYDSSVFPIHHDQYGIPSAPRGRYVARAGILECPPTTFRCLGKNLPVGGGGYLRLYPWWLTNSGLKQVLAQKRNIIAYIHPWELDPGQPRIGGKPTLVARHYMNLRKTEERVRKLLGLTRYTSFRESIRRAVA